MASKQNCMVMSTIFSDSVWSAAARRRFGFRNGCRFATAEKYYDAARQSKAQSSLRTSERSRANQRRVPRRSRAQSSLRTPKRSRAIQRRVPRRSGAQTCLRTPDRCRTPVHCNRVNDVASPHSMRDVLAAARPRGALTVPRALRARVRPRQDQPVCRRIRRASSGFRHPVPTNIYSPELEILTDFLRNLLDLAD